MGIFGRNKNADLEELVRGSVAQAFEQQKELDYSKYEPRNQYAGGFSLSPLEITWTDPADYSKRVKATYKNATAKACVLKRAQAIANIDIKYVGENKAVKELLKRPNHRDGTIQVLLNDAEIHLSVGGDVYFFWDCTVPNSPKLHTLRPDLVINDVQNSRYLYKPSQTDKPDFTFEYDRTGKTTRVLKRVGAGESVISGGLQHIRYFDPLTATKGVGAGESALAAIDVMNAIDRAMAGKFRAGGTKAGYFQVKGDPTDADIAKLKAQMAALNPDGMAHVLPGGVEFNAAQLTLAEMEILAARAEMKQDICAAFQVPAELINASQSTYANARGMDKIFYRNFIGPEAHWLIGQLEVGLQLYVDANAKITVDEASAPHLEEDRLERASKMAQMKCFTADEIRAALGYEAAPEGTEFVGADVNMGQPEEKPKGPVAFNADAGSRGDKNEQ